ncbi:MAG: hypothetical protein IPP58_00900 [Holophagaceae bacterium]|uniref:Lipoprotein n=1 Tax=Candidatus Geothrix skivensis TaxID=2954439 RepID=A0A9D7SCJ6_9BACT|nr:hypothetical protein [Candidatus Geothrix skivensis]
MPLFRASLQTLGAIALLALALACSGKKDSSSDSPTATLSGTVTYLRVPLAKDAGGVPTGLKDSSVAANLVSLPARGVRIRILQQVSQTLPGSSTPSLVWLLTNSGSTDSSGAYSLTNVTKGRPTMVEVLSTFNGGGSQSILLIADPAGIASSQPAQDRVQYALRKAADGTALATDPTHASVFSVNSTVDFSVGLNDVWWITNPATSQVTGVGNVHADLETDPVLFPGRTSGTGSRVLGIGDTIASWAKVEAYGSGTPGAALLLHYWPGRSEPGGSYVLYDQSLLPLARSSSSYFGTLRGGPANDDAWDEGIILPLLARNALYASTLNRTFGVTLNPLFPPVSPQTDLSADMARIEGLAQAMAANVLKSPYLADTQGASLAAPLVDVRDLSTLSPAQFGPLSAPAMRGFAWEIVLKANGLPSPGIATDWDKIDPLAAARFFVAPTSTTSTEVEPLNLFNQVARLKEGKGGTEPVDLAAIFTDTVLAGLGTPFGLPWPRPSTGLYASFVSDWGIDPTGVLPATTFSMAKASQVSSQYPSPSLAFPNVSSGEVHYAKFRLSADTRCSITATMVPALGPGAQVDLDLPFMSRTFSFTGSGGTTGPIIIPVISAAPALHPVRIRLKSPGSVQPDVTVSLTLTPLP